MIDKYTPHLIIVQGDTTSALSAAMSAFYNQIPVAHVEAGLRSFNIENPFPEEFNRKTITTLSKHHFTTTEIAKRDLLDEKVNIESIFYVGNIIVDSFNYIIKNNDDYKIKKSNKILITCHRRENWNDKLKNLCESLKNMCEEYKEYEFIFCSHPNPLVYNVVTSILSNTRITLRNSMPYDEFLKLLLGAKVIITDSGGIQEEACILGTPTLVYRNVTERPEGLGNCLIMAKDISILNNELCKLLTNDEYYKKYNKKIYCYGNGDTSQKITRILEYIYGDSKNSKQRK